MLTALLLNGVVYSNEDTFETLEIVQVHQFNDPDEGAFFTLNDGSKWYRTWWAGPVYYPEIGQKVVIAPMSEEEAELIQSPLPGLTPYWIYQDAEPSMAIAFLIFFN